MRSTPFFLVVLALFQVLNVQAQLSRFLYEGMLTEGGNPANGQYDVLVTAHDAVTGGNQLGTTNEFLNLSVAAGKFTVSVDFGPSWLDGTDRWLETKVRKLGESYVTLTPRQRVYAAPMANLAARALTVAPGAINSSQLADGSITSAKLAPSVTATLGTPSGTLIGSFDLNATALLNSGYVRVPGLTSTVGGWSPIPELSAQTNSYSTADGFSSLWTGSELFVYGRESLMFQARATRFNPATGLWNPVPTNAAPKFMSSTRLNLVQGGTNLFAFGDVDTSSDNTNSTGGYFNLASGTWQNIPTNGFTRIYDDGSSRQAFFCWTGSELLAVGNPSFSIFDAALFNPATNGWRRINTNGHPQIFIDGSASLGWNGTELLVFGASATNFGSRAGGLYNPATESWRPASTNNSPRGNNKRVLWTGTEWIGFYTSSDFSVPSAFNAYNPQSDTWRRCATNGMPSLGAPGMGIPNYFWTGAEVGMILQLGTTTKRTAVYLYQPTTDTWRSFLSSEPAIASGITDFSRVISPQWTGTEVIAYLPVTPDDGSPNTVFRQQRFVPQRTLYIYQRN